MRVKLTCLFALFSLFAVAQRVVDVDKSDGVPLNSLYTVNGSPVVNTRFVRLTQGTPYFVDKWLPGTAVSGKDARYKSSRLKLDLFENEVHYLTDAEQELICTVPLKEVTLIDSAAGESFRFVHSSFVPALAAAKKGWYRQLADGKASLYQFFAKIVNEYREYNSSVTEQRITTAEEFLIAYNGALLRAKKPKDVPALFPDKKKELESFLSRSEAKNGSNAERMTALINYCNSLL